MRYAIVNTTVNTTVKGGRALYSKGLIEINRDAFDWGQASLRGIVAHELGHHHHYWVEKNRPDIWQKWEVTWRSLKAGILDGYAAKDACEGWAELYRLSLGASFEAGAMGTAGDWQWSPILVKVALATWGAYASCYKGEVFCLQGALSALKGLKPQAPSEEEGAN